jgi:hypothetical protein
MTIEGEFSSEEAAGILFMLQENHFCLLCKKIHSRDNGTLGDRGHQ